MNNTVNPQSENQSDEIQDSTSLAILKLIGQIVCILKWIIIIPLSLLAAMILVYFMSLVGVWQPVNPADLNQKIAPLMEQLTSLVANLGTSIWSFLSPILTLAVIIILAKWLLFPRVGERIGNKLSTMVTDIPGFIAVAVVSTVCIMPLLRVEVPAAFSNIALVIVGYYFGSERNRQDTQGDNDRV